jgi:hypothetical protein
MTWHPDGRFQLTAHNGIERWDVRRPLASIDQPLVAYSIAGPSLLDETIPHYSSDIDVGATVQLDAHAVLEEPAQVALHLILVKHGEEPYHRETVGDRRIDDGQPDIWVVLDRSGDEPPRRVAVAQRILRWPPPIRAQAKPES